MVMPNQLYSLSTPYYTPLCTRSHFTFVIFGNLIYELSIESQCVQFAKLIQLIIHFMLSISFNYNLHKIRYRIPWESFAE